MNELFGQSNTSFTNEEAIAMKRYMTLWIAVCHLFGTAGQSVIGSGRQKSGITFGDPALV